MNQPVLLYWMHETSGALAKYVQQLMNKEPLTEDAISGLKTYFAHWANYPYVIANNEHGHQLAQLREAIGEAQTKEDLLDWLDDAIKLGIDPL